MVASVEGQGFSGPGVSDGDRGASERRRGEELWQTTVHMRIIAIVDMIARSASATGSPS
ncbi:hypothetical protein ABZ639_05765 [Saccharomonospora sp. NPDC006951]